jgi:hypothetical protein
MLVPAKAKRKQKRFPDSRFGRIYVCSGGFGFSDRIESPG